MKKKQQKAIVIMLISIGLFLILITYYPFIKKAELIRDQSVQKDLEKNADEDETTSFDQVEYKGLFNDQPFTIRSEKAHLQKESNEIFMTNMHMILYLKDGRILNIISNKGKYNRISHDTFFEGDVTANDGETELFGQKLDLLATKNFIEIWDDVTLIHPTGTLWAEKIVYDFTTKYFRVTAKPNDIVKMEVIK